MTAPLTRRAVAAMLNVVLFGTFGAVPLLDGVVTEYTAVIESEHGSCDYVRTHDHAICVQFGSNTATAARSPASFHPIPRVDDLSGTGEADSAPVRPAVLRERSRAPPLA
ncbi:MAG: hypothetical protein HKN73_17660 [Gemmatimonadetes bacterium]|nr:hypothetical protein [Gemmatimonadota bacterium]